MKLHEQHSVEEHTRHKLDRPIVWDGIEKARFKMASDVIVSYHIMLLSVDSNEIVSLPK